VSELPSGTVTFLFTDVEGSTRLWEDHPEAMQVALARHDEIVRGAVVAHAGQVVKTTGDGFHAVFASVEEALGAATDAQVALYAEAWGLPDGLRVRMGLHTCNVKVRDGDYYGAGVNRAARLMSVAHGGQVVVSAATAELARESVFELRDLGEYRLAGLARPERVSQLCPAGLVEDFPPLRSVDELPGNLPRQVTSFVGRDAELEMLADLVRTRPLVTLTGVGGVGKTRLALEVAAEAIRGFPEGAWLCELAPVTDRDALWGSLAATFRLLPPPGRNLDEVLVEYLAPKRLLLVLDNCEHLLDAVAAAVEVIKARCPQVSVLATSREGLAVPGEQLVAVPSLGVPAVDVDDELLGLVASVRLFCDRASSVKRDFDATGPNLAAVGVLCRRLDGIPLAIELAAARSTSLAPHDLVARLDQRFKLLARGSRASLERHQTLRNTIDWSYDLLDDHERAALQRLSVFAGGCDLAAAEAVLGDEELDPLDVVDVVGQLVDKSLVLADTDEDGQIRYRMLETIRQYAQERLEVSGHTAGVRARHAAYYVTLAETAGSKLRNRDQLVWARRMAGETDNLRAALNWAVETASADSALRMVASLAVHGVAIGYSALDWAETAIEITSAHDHPLFPAVASWAAWSAVLHGDLDHADDLVVQAEAAQAARGQHEPSVSRAAAILAFFGGDLALGRVRAEEWVAVARPTGDPYEIAQALTLLTGAQSSTGDLDRARASGQEAVQVARDAAIPAALSIAVSMLSGTLPIDESDRMLALLDEAIQVGTQIGDRLSVATSIANKGWVLAYRGDNHLALRAASEAAERYLHAGDLATTGVALSLGAVALTHLGQPEPAAVLFGVARRLVGGALPVWAEQLISDAETALIAQLGEAQYDTLRAQGAALTPVDALAYLINAAQTTTAES
jgi:predicted ATPase/class 3 adenylate cyclase